MLENTASSSSRLSPSPSAPLPFSPSARLRLRRLSSLLSRIHREMEIARETRRQAHRRNILPHSVSDSRIVCFDVHIYFNGNIHVARSASESYSLVSRARARARSNSRRGGGSYQRLGDSAARGSCALILPHRHESAGLLNPRSNPLIRLARNGSAAILPRARKNREQRRVLRSEKLKSVERGSSSRRDIAVSLGEYPRSSGIAILSRKVVHCRGWILLARAATSNGKFANFFKCEIKVQQASAPVRGESNPSVTRSDNGGSSARSAVTALSVTVGRSKFFKRRNLAPRTGRFVKR